jgi:menaquinone-specific isochorismate synthase
VKKAEHVSNFSIGDASDRSAGASPAVSGATRPRFGEVIIHNRGHLPHWEKDSATYFVTFRLADSLPQSVLERIESERQSIVQTAKQLQRDLSADERKRIQQLSTKTIEQYLDNGVGGCHLRNPVIANEVAETLLLFDNKRYRLFAWCLMPNHVHVVLRLFPGQVLASVVHSWKSFTSKQANNILGRSGRFWQREYYDHLIRNEGESERAIRYVAQNPEKASLKEWKWVWVCGQDARTTAAEDGGATKPPEP